MRWSIVSIGFLTLLCSACSAERKFYDRPAGVAGVGSMIEPAAFEEIDLVTLLDPQGLGEYPAGADEAQRLQIALDAFREYPSPPLRERRDAVQERMLAASNQRCNYFKSYLQASRGGANFVFGSLATATGAAGAIVGGIASQILSGTAAVFSGVRAEYNQEFYANVATHVVTQGIDLRRRQVYEQIALQGQAKSYEAYNVEAAIKDAIYYHGECSTVVGIQMASDTVTMFEDPGLDAANRVLAKLKTTRRLLDDRNLDPGEAVKLINTTETLLKAGTPLGAADSEATDPLDQLAMSLEGIAVRAAAFREVIAQVPGLEEAQVESLEAALQSAREHAATLAQACQAAAVAASRALAEARVAAKAAELPGAEATAVVNARFALAEAERRANGVSAAIRKAQDLLAAHLATAKQRLLAPTLDVAAVQAAITAMNAEPAVCV